MSARRKVVAAAPLKKSDNGASELLKMMQLDDEEPAPIEDDIEPTEDLAEESESSSESSEDTGVYFVGFLHPPNLRTEEIPFKVFSSNNVKESRETWEQGSVNGLKTHVALYCVEGNAIEVVEAFQRIYAAKSVPKKTGWYKISKKSIELFIQKLTTKNPKNYIVVSEAKAKIKR